MKILIAALLACAHMAAASPVDSLLDSTAADFKAHGPRPVDARAVRAGVISQDGKAQTIICGQVLPAGDGKDWTDFSTIRTSGYEQAVGWQATALCAKAKIDTDKDLTPALKMRLGLK
jgi:hypothetical protein